MVHWPDDDKLTDTARSNVERFRKTAVAKELEQGTQAWQVVNWPWTPDPPHRFILRDDARREMTFTMEANGVWTTGAA